MSYEICYWEGGRWLPFDEGVQEWLAEIVMHDPLVRGRLPDVRAVAA